MDRLNDQEEFHFQVSDVVKAYVVVYASHSNSSVTVHVTQSQY